MSKANQETAKERLAAAKQEENPLFNTDRKIRAKRLKVSFPVQITHKGSPIQGWVEASNISFSGMLLLTNFPMNLRDEFTIEFTLPGHDIPVQAKARAVRITNGRTHDEPTVMAVAFFQIDQNVSKIISGFVLENLSSY